MSVQVLDPIGEKYAAHGVARVKEFAARFRAARSDAERKKIREEIRAWAARPVSDMLDFELKRRREKRRDADRRGSARR